MNPPDEERPAADVTPDASPESAPPPEPPPAKTQPQPPAPLNFRDALGAIADLRDRVLQRQRFRGYSGTARAAGGTLALAATLLAQVSGAAASDTRLLALWGVVFIGALTLNYGAVLWWRATSRRDMAALSPALEPLPILLAGGLLTAALLAHAPAPLTDLVLGTWMCLLGLTQFTAKYALPRRIRLVGWFYIAAATACLLLGETAWRQPLLSGLVFALGEWAGALILHNDAKTAPSPVEASDDDCGNGS